MVRAHNVAKRIFKMKKDFNDLKEKYNNKEISCEELKGALDKLLNSTDLIDKLIDLVEEEMDRLVIRYYVDMQDDIIKFKNSLTVTTSA